MPQAGGGVKKDVTDMQDTAGIEKNEDVFLLMLCDPGGPQAALQPQSLRLTEQPVSRCGSKRDESPGVVTSRSLSIVPPSAEGSEVQAGGSSAEGETQS